MGLAVANLSCHRSGRPVLRNVTLTIADGEAVLLRGPNGAGKSTLLRALAGLLPYEGAVSLTGGVSLAPPEAYGEELAYFGHEDAFKPQLTVAENLTFWSKLFEGGDITRALEAFDLIAIADRPAHVCSAGQKRRLGLARLLVAERRLWLLDEPTNSLDAAACEGFAAVVRAHCAAGGLALIATHVDLGLDEAREYVLSPLAPESSDASADPFVTGGWT